MSECPMCLGLPYDTNDSVCRLCLGTGMLDGDDGMEDDGPDELCPHCDGDGSGIVGLDWDCEDAINGPYDGEVETCPWCGGSGLACDVSIW